MKIHHKNQWPRKTLKNKALGGFIGSFMFLIFALLHGSQFQKHGYVTFHYSPKYFDRDAELMIMLPTIIGLILLAISVYFLLKLYLLTYAGKIPEDNELPPKYVICSDCEEAYMGFETEGMICSKCGGKLVDIKAYYSENGTKAEIKRTDLIEKIQHQ